MKKIFILIIMGIFLVSFIAITNINLVSAIEVSYCCEKLTNGAWCQNAPESSCDSGYRKVPTSCEATSYCRLGTCYDSEEGNCMENTPEIVCNEKGGVWAQGKPEEVPQCTLGCCLIGEQAAFVTQTRCRRLSSIYGLEIDFRTSIGSEVECIMSATSDAKGACVFDREFEKTCLFTSQKDCVGLSSGNASGEKEFHEGYLCSAPELGTVCSGQKGTKCIEESDEVYFVDLCGNLANIYDSSKTFDKDKTYWSKIVPKSEICGADSSNANSATCGNCDYFLGSTCKEFDRSEDQSKPTYGDNICRDLSCELEGEDFSHGETWCAEAKGIDKSLPGSRHFRMVCYDNDVTVEGCADFRQEVCLQDEINGFRTAACRVNMWQDCVAQDNKKDCENIDRRDCKWTIAQAETENNKTIACVPAIAPGFDFWSSEGDAQSVCSLASETCVVEYEKKLSRGKKIVKNEKCLDDSWEAEKNQMCINMGDCGSSVNYLGIQGYHNESAIKKKDVEEE